MKRSKSGIRVMFSLSFFVLLISSVASYLSIYELNDSESWVRHTSDVIQKLDSVVSRMKDAETGYRGYFLTGNKVFLEPYNGSKVQVDQALSAAELLTRDNEEQQKIFPELKKLIEEKYKLAGGWIAKKEVGADISTQEMLHGKEVMDSIRAVISVMKKREQDLMVIRQERSSKFGNYTPLSVMAGAFLAILLTVFFYFKLKRDLERNERLQKELEFVENDRQRQIEIIDKMAKKVAGGDYSARIDINELKDNPQQDLEKPKDEDPPA